ncbi:putative ATP-dependent endonuclease of the OLD family [Nitrosomonas eutropha]|uniref:Putative ATP-dependent endonuclease of the OLD family n=1 Tax=Nitrosomonas eutropha TaxID=916 RepID=A0A1I7FYP4_9PROT|nr:TOPRIM nucleotidyl transferase/hydrolase domain-containing protein [Nitrosomonas eutropha]SFU41334.1 putative ATP-dependent endonuclease of the OLD family [Nitrosomonas eutropha]
MDKKLVATHSGDLLSEVDVYSIRRLYKKGSAVQVGALQSGTLDERQLQKFDHFVRGTRGELFFARVWILVEGETDVILLSGSARVLGLDLEQSAIRLVEYAQVGLSTFISAADSLGIAWHIFSMVMLRELKLR